jgi:outer membrane protein assembly factor BamB
LAARHSLFGRIDGALATVAVLGATLATACARETPPPPREASPHEPSERDLVVLPNNTALYARREHLVAVRREGEVLWEANLPSGDIIVAPLATALNSSAFVRGAKALHAISPEGKWLWSKQLEGQAFGKRPATNAPTAFPDSTVAVAVGDDILRFDEKGVLRWRVSLPEGHLVARMRAGMDGAVFVPTTAGLYCLAPDGNVSWVRSIGN